MLVQKVRNMIDEINYIRTDEVLGVCEYCNRNPVTKCRKCECIVGKYISMRNKVYENKRARFVAWLIKLNDLLQELLDTKSICKHKFYRECHSVLELKQLVSELKSPLRQHQPDITNFPSITPEISFDALGESKEMLEDILKTIKTEGSRQYTSDTNLTSSSRSSTGCVCKYFTNKNMDGRRSMEVLPQEKYYPPGLITSREFAKRFASEGRYKSSLDRERLGDRRSPSAEYRFDYAREGTSKERRLHVVSDKISNHYGNESETRRDEHGREIVSMRYGKESQSRRGEYRKERGSKKEEYGKSRALKKETSVGYKDKLPEIAPQKSKLAKNILNEIHTDVKSKQKSKNIKSVDTLNRQTLKEDKTEKHKTDITKKGKKSKINIFEEDNLKMGKKTKDKTGKVESNVDKNTKSKEAEKGNRKESKLISNSSDIKVIIKDEESRKRLRAKGKHKVLKDKDSQSVKQSEIFEFDSDKENKVTSKIKMGKENGIKKRRSSEAVLLLKVMKEMQMRREKGRDAKKEKEKVVVTLENLPVIERKTKTKVEPALSESFVKCDVGQKEEITEMILGKEVAPFDPFFKIEKDPGPKPLLFKIMQTFPKALLQTEEPQMQTEQKYVDTHSKNKSVAPISSKIKKSKTDIVEKSGILKYQLSNRQFIEKGWTALPTTKMLKKINTYNMKMANPEFDFFKVKKKKKRLYYDTGEKLAEIYSNESGKWFYKNGNLALDCYRPKEPNIKKRYIIYSSGDDKENGISLPITILGLFDQLGNAVIYDHFGNVRLKYNQSEGVLIDSKIGAPGRWKWHALNDPPVLQPVFLDTYLQERYEDLDEIIRKEEERIKPELSTQDPTFDNMIMIEFDNFVKEKANKLLQTFKPFQIKMKAVKINEHFSIRILDQACVAITFQDAPNTLKLNLGMHLINTEIVDTETCEVSEVATPYDRIPAKTESVSNIQEALNKARKFGRSIIKRTQSSSTVKRPKGAVSRQPNTTSSE